MKIKVWAKTDVVGSKTEDIIELPEYLTEDEINEEAHDYIFNFVEWGWERVSDEDNTGDEIYRQ